MRVFGYGSTITRKRLEMANGFLKRGGVLEGPPKRGGVCNNDFQRWKIPMINPDHLESKHSMVNIRFLLRMSLKSCHSTYFDLVFPTDATQCAYLVGAEDRTCLYQTLNFRSVRQALLHARTPHPAEPCSLTPTCRPSRSLSLFCLFSTIFTTTYRDQFKNIVR